MSPLFESLAIFWSPTRALTAAAGSRRLALPLALATAAAVAFAGAAYAQLDFERTGAEALDLAASSAKMTPHEREQAIAASAKIARVGLGAGSLLGPTASALAAALCLWLGFKVAGGTPRLHATAGVTAHALLPLALARLLSIPALLLHPGLTPSDAERLLPSSLAAFFDGLPTLDPKWALLASVDLFSLWALALVAAGMAEVARVSRLRAGLTTFVLWAAYVALFKLAPMAAVGGAR